MDLQQAIDITKYNFLFSSRFPFRTGNLRNNFFDNAISTSDKSISFTVMSSPNLIVGKNKVNYGKLLEQAPSIRYGLKKKGYLYSYIRHQNKHYRYIEKIIENDVVPALETDLGVKLI